ncbi:acyltransferase family protein [Nonomuraea fuscirosea]|uniref:acyltransferase family protein n=1 Tax=Nonomuraea fuscirosea TaxID=1291556 RepID=UPI00340D005B
MRGMVATVRDLAVRTPDSRERGVDMWRALAICLVVFGHWFVVAVTYRDGRLAGYNALDILRWMDPVTWLFQVMPIFFLVGGYAAGASMASHRASGGDSISWVLKRTDRLLRPTTALFLGLTLVSVAAVAAGVNSQLVGHAAWLASIPLWFLLAYLTLVVFTPWLHALHRRAGLAVPVVMVVIVAVADLLRTGLHVPIVGLSTYLFAWLTLYQLGFCWRDGLLRLGRGGAVAVAAGGLAALVALTVVGPYPVGMVGDNTAPPSLALMALAATQVGLILALQPAAGRWLRRIGPWSAVIATNAVILTVFLWHMTAAAVAAALLFPTGVLRQPPPQSASWLLWRVPWLASCAIVLAVLVALFARIELRRSVPRSVERGLWRDGATVLGMAAVLAGLLLVAVAGPGYHGPTGLPWAGVLAYLSGAAVLRVVRTRSAPPAVDRR